MIVVKYNVKRCMWVGVRTLKTSFLEAVPWDGTCPTNTPNRYRCAVLRSQRLIPCNIQCYLTLGIQNFVGVCIV